MNRTAQHASAEMLAIQKFYRDNKCIYAVVDEIKQLISDEDHLKQTFSSLPQKHRFDEVRKGFIAEIAGIRAKLEAMAQHILDARAKDAK